MEMNVSLKAKYEEREKGWGKHKRQWACRGIMKREKSVGVMNVGIEGSVGD